MSAVYDPNLPLYFQHIPKTAGTSVATMLAGAFQAERICPVTHWDNITALSPAQLGQYGLFIGHYAHYLGRYLDTPINRFTLLRDPVERTISHYAHIVRAAHHPYHTSTIDKTLLEFVQDPVTRHNVVNYQARYIADMGLDIREIIPRFRGPPGARTPLHMYVDELSRNFSQAALRDAAIKALDGFFLIGTTDALPQVMDRLAQLTGLQFAEAPRANVDPNALLRPAPDDATLAAIREATQIDQELYNIVRSRALVGLNG